MSFLGGGGGGGGGCGNFEAPFCVDVLISLGQELHTCLQMSETYTSIIQHAIPNNKATFPTRLLSDFPGCFSSKPGLIPVTFS